MAKRSEVDEIEEMSEGLRIDKNALDDALLQQPQLFYSVSEKLALAISRRDAAKNELELIEAEVDSTIRLRMRDDGIKTTEKEIEAEKVQHKDVQGAEANLIHLTHQAARWQALQSALSQRSYVLKDLVALHLRAYYSSEAAGASSREQLYDDRRERMHRERGSGSDAGRSRRD
jgi:hypothetical protein